MDNRLLDVAIGLVLVFALTSLLATAVSGFLLTALQRRGKNLNVAIASMLGDDPQLAAKFYLLPLVRTLYIGERHPSYLEPDIFCSALFDLLSKEGKLPLNKGQGTPQQYVSALRAAYPAPDTGLMAPITGLPAIGETLQSLCAGVENDWPAFEARVKGWFNATADRSIGWFTRSTQSTLFVVGFVIAVVLNINPIVIGSALWRDPVLREATVEAARAAVAERAGSAPAAAATPGANAASAGKPKAEAATDAAARIFTDKQFMDLLHTLEHGQNASSAVKELMVNASRLSQELSYERTLRSMPSRQDAALKTIQDNNDKLRSNLDADLQALVKANDPRLDKGLLSLAQNRLKGITQGIANERHIVLTASQPKAVAGPKPVKECTRVAGTELKDQEVDRALGSLCSLGLPMGWDEELQPPFMFKNPWLDFFGAMVLGYLIMAGACSMGAQFWFDTLSKLVKLRGAGDKPDPSKGDGGAASAGSTASNPSTLSGNGMLSAPFQSALNEQERGLSEAQVRDIQRNMGMPNHLISGALDGHTRQSIIEWHKARNLGSSNELTSSDIAQLLQVAAAVPPGTTSPSHGDDLEEHLCGCDVEITQETVDEDLPPSQGG